MPRILHQTWDQKPAPPAPSSSLLDGIIDYTTPAYYGEEEDFIYQKLEIFAGDVKEPSVMGSGDTVFKTWVIFLGPLLGSKLYNIYFL